MRSAWVSAGRDALRIPLCHGGVVVYLRVKQSCTMPLPSGDVASSTTRGGCLRDTVLEAFSFFEAALDCSRFPNLQYSQNSTPYFRRRRHKTDVLTAVENRDAKTFTFAYRVRNKAIPF